MCNVMVVILREYIYVNRDVHERWNVAYLSNNLLAKQIYEKCTPKLVKWSTNYSMSSSENIDEREMKCDQISRNLHVYI